MAEVVADVIVDASPQRVWDVVTDWTGQDRWITATTVRVVEGDGRSVGSRVEAFSGFGRAGFLDVMVVTRWEPPMRCDVDHVGNVVRGTGTFEVLALPNGHSRFVWSEDLDLPLGALGRLGWPLVRPGFVAGVKHSLRAMARIAESGE